MEEAEEISVVPTTALLVMEAIEGDLDSVAVIEVEAEAEEDKLEKVTGSVQDVKTRTLLGVTNATAARSQREMMLAQEAAVVDVSVLRSTS